MLPLAPSLYVSHFKFYFLTLLLHQLSFGQYLHIFFSISIYILWLLKYMNSYLPPYVFCLPFFHFASYISSFLPYVLLIKCYIFPHLILCSIGSFILLMVAFQILPWTINCTFFLTVTQYISLPIVHKNDLSIFYPLILLNTSFIVLLLLLFRIWVLSFFHPKSVGFFFSFTVNR